MILYCLCFCIFLLIFFLINIDFYGNDVRKKIEEKNEIEKESYENIAKFWQEAIGLRNTLNNSTKMINNMMKKNK